MFIAMDVLSNGMASIIWAMTGMLQKCRECEIGKVVIFVMISDDVFLNTEIIHCVKQFHYKLIPNILNTISW